MGVQDETAYVEREEMHPRFLQEDTLCRYCLQKPNVVRFTYTEKRSLFSIGHLCEAEGCQVSVCRQPLEEALAWWASHFGV